MAATREQLMHKVLGLKPGQCLRVPGPQLREAAQESPTQWVSDEAFQAFLQRTQNAWGVTVRRDAEWGYYTITKKARA